MAVVTAVATIVMAATMMTAIVVTTVVVSSVMPVMVAGIMPVLRAVVIGAVVRTVRGSVIRRRTAVIVPAAERQQRNRQGANQQEAFHFSSTESPGNLMARLYSSRAGNTTCNRQATAVQGNAKTTLLP